jgi:UDP-N-acetylglucosamine 2-epimerase (non-hydrolysing)
MKKLKVVTIVGTRPEIIRLSRLIPKLDEHTDHILVHTGQNYDPMLSDVFFKDLELRQPDNYLNVDTTSFGTVMGDVIKKSEEILLKEKPDAVMILGDTNSSIAAIVAERLHIPVYHMEAGNRSFDNNVPEELNRRMVDHVSTFNLPYSEHARRNLLYEGIHPRFIYKTGSPIKEVFEYNKEKIEKSAVLDRLGVSEGEYFLVSVHRQENIDSPHNLDKIVASLAAIQNYWRLPVIVSTHPRTRDRIRRLSLNEIDGVTFHEPFGYFDYCRLQLGAKCTVSDSGSVSEEAAIMGFHTVTIRESMERPEALEESFVVMSGLEPENVIRSINFMVSRQTSPRLPVDYDEPNFSSRVLGLLFSALKT